MVSQKEYLIGVVDLDQGNFHQNIHQISYSNQVMMLENEENYLERKVCHNLVKWMGGLVGQNPNSL